jgi:hypothetical protein
MEDKKVFFLHIFVLLQVGRGTVAFNVTAVPNGKLVVTQNGHQSETMDWESIVSRCDSLVTCR